MIFTINIPLQFITLTGACYIFHIVNFDLSHIKRLLQLITSFPFKCKGRGVASINWLKDICVSYDYLEGTLFSYRENEEKIGLVICFLVRMVGFVWRSKHTRACNIISDYIVTWVPFLHMKTHRRQFVEDPLPGQRP